VQLLFEFLPIILFFIAFKLKGIFFATAVAVAAGICQAAVSWARKRKVEPVLIINLAVLSVFGGFTLLLHNELFIKWKPTILYGLFAVILSVAQLSFGKNLVRSLLAKSITLPDRVWGRLNLSWILFFAGLGGLNLFVACHFPTATWVNFKLFGILGCTLAFFIIQSIVLAPYVRDVKDSVPTPELPKTE
jgi:intracellular septation protein